MKANEKAYTGLMEAFADNTKVANAQDKAKKLRDGQYNRIVAAAAICKSREEWEATDDLLQKNITHNVDGAAAKVGAEEREKPTEGGARYTMPRSITNALAVIRFAWQNAIPLTVKNKKSGKVEHVSLGSLRKARAQKLDEAKAAEAQSLTGVAKFRHECLVMLGKIAAGVEKMADDNVQAMHKDLSRVLHTLEPEVVKAAHAKAGAKAITTADVAAGIAKAA